MKTPSNALIFIDAEIIINSEKHESNIEYTEYAIQIYMQIFLYLLCFSFRRYIIIRKTAMIICTIQNVFA